MAWMYTQRRGHRLTRYLWYIWTVSVTGYGTCRSVSCANAPTDTPPPETSIKQCLATNSSKMQTQTQRAILSACNVGHDIITELDLSFNIFSLSALFLVSTSSWDDMWLLSQLILHQLATYNVCCLVLIGAFLGEQPPPAAEFSINKASETEQWSCSQKSKTIS